MQQHEIVTDQCVYPLATIVIPCYNHGAYLNEALESALNQSYPNIEIIIVNDGSTESSTLEVLHSIHHPRVRLIHTHNQGLATARNIGIRHANGTYILPLDSDDRIASAYAQQAIACLESDSKIGIVYCHAAFFGKQSGVWNLPEYRFPDILMDNVIFCSGWYRKTDWERVGGYNPNMTKGYEDWDFWLSLIETGCGVYRLADTLFFYRKSLTPSMVDRLQKGSLDDRAMRHQLARNHPELFIKHFDLFLQGAVSKKKRRRLF